MRLESTLLHMYSLDAISQLHKQFEELKPAAGRLPRARQSRPIREDNMVPPAAIGFQYFHAPTNATNRVAQGRGAYPTFIVDYGRLSLEFTDLESFGTTLEGVNGLRDVGRRSFLTAENGIELPSGIDDLALSFDRPFTRSA